MQRFAIYDLDRTLTRLPTWSRFLLFVMLRRQQWRLLLVPLIGIGALLRAAGLIDRTRLKEIMHRVAIGAACNACDLAKLSEAFADAEVRENIAAAALAQIIADGSEGRRLVIATAAHAFYAVPIARRLGIDDVVATKAVTDMQGRVLWQIDGDNCYGTAKQRMIAGWLSDAEPDRAAAHVRFYSDHLTDLPTLQWADEAVVINARPPLAAIAQARGWQALRWS